MSDPGTAALLFFVAALLLIVVAVVVVGAIDQWWVLAPVMLVDFAATFAVVRVIGGLLNDDDGHPHH